VRAVKFVGMLPFFPFPKKKDGPFLRKGPPEEKTSTKQDSRDAAESFLPEITTDA
jgi:hypothetical protein